MFQQIYFKNKQKIMNLCLTSKLCLRPLKLVKILGNLLVNGPLVLNRIYNFPMTDISFFPDSSLLLKTPLPSPIQHLIIPQSTNTLIHSTKTSKILSSLPFLIFQPTPIIQKRLFSPLIFIKHPLHRLFTIIWA